MKKENIFLRIFLIVILLFPLTTLFTSFSIISTVNKFLVGLLIISIGVLFITKIKIKSLFIYIFTILLVFIDFYFTKLPIYNINETLYLLMWVLVLTCFTDNYFEINYSMKEMKWIFLLIILIWEFFVFFSFFLDTSYVGNSFSSFTGGKQHRFASSALLICAFILAIRRYYKNLFLFLLIIPIFSIIITGARTYLIIAILLITLIYYKKCKNLQMFYISIVPILLLCCIIIYNTNSMQERIEQFMNLKDYSNDFWYALTSGRSSFWIIDLEYIFKSKPINIFLGNGFNFIRYVNINFYGQNIWAHNDFIQLLGTNGIVGLFIYLYVYFRLTSYFYKKNKRFEFFLLHTINFSNAMLNMLYTYFTSMLSIPFLIIYILSEQD